MNKKLQVFVSSTYTDLIEERQAAVEAILDAGHIPAGMELFKAGKSQMQTIRNWIDESDVYMLILGGRYGSIEEESGLSYTELEYRYALSRNMPVFAVVLSESFLTAKINLHGLSNIIEQKAPDKYQTFKSLVMSKIIRIVADCKDIKITIHPTLNEFLDKYNLTGWVRNNNENDIIQLTNENDALIIEKNLLNNKIQKLQEQLQNKKGFGNSTFQELYDILKFKKFSNSQTQYTALDYFTFFYSGKYQKLDEKIFDYLNAYNLIDAETYTEYNTPNPINTLLSSYRPSLIDVLTGYREHPRAYPIPSVKTKQVKTKIGRLFYLYLNEYGYV